MHAYHAVLPAPPCRLGAVFDGEALARLDFLPADVPLLQPDEARVRMLAAELEAYWNDPDHVFALPCAPSGTAFQRAVWQKLLTIPRGAVTTYGALAQSLGSAPRAVGQACGANPLPILVPCHRVVAAGGLGGFMHASRGAPLDVKRWLLAHEGHRGARPAPRATRMQAA